MHAEQVLKSQLYTDITHSQIMHFNPSCTKVFDTHTFYGRGGGGWANPHDLENGSLYKLQLWQAIRTIYER